MYFSPGDGAPKQSKSSCSSHFRDVQFQFFTLKVTGTKSTTTQSFPRRAELGWSPLRPRCTTGLPRARLTHPCRGCTQRTSLRTTPRSCLLPPSRSRPNNAVQSGKGPQRSLGHNRSLDDRPQVLDGIELWAASWPSLQHLHAFLRARDRRFLSAGESGASNFGLPRGPYPRRGVKRISPKRILPMLIFAKKLLL